ncbi:MAG TPA: glycosyltransferase [Roseiflexaceae bacterium]|nr:glycosyltransferase [Roseiflexaceae bacterium]
MNRPAHILLLIGQLTSGGTERQLINLARAVDPQRYRVSVGVLSQQLDLADELQQAGIVVHSLGGLGFYPWHTLPQWVARVAALIRREQPALLMTYLYPANVIGTLAAAICRVPAIISERTADPVLPLQQRLAYTLITRLCHVVMVNSYAARATMQQQLRLPAGRLVVQPNGIDLAVLDRPVVAGAWRTMHGVAADELLIGAIGRIDRLKQYELLLQIAAACRDEGMAARFVIAGGVGTGGDHAYHDELREQHRLLRLDRQLLFAGPQPQIAAVLDAIDLFVQTSKQEGTPNALLEALAYGVPALVTDVGDMRRIVEQGACGMALPPDPQVWRQQMQALLADPRRRAALGANGRLYVRGNYALEHLAHATQALWDHVIGR